MGYYDFDERYKNGKIYALFGNSNMYIGSTITTLANRLSRHKSKSNVSSSINCIAEDCRIVLLENYPCHSRYELERRERTWIETYYSINVNILKPAMNTEEKLRLNAECSRRYRENHKEQIEIRRSQKFECECGGKYVLRHKSTHKKSKRHIKYFNLHYV